MLVLMLRSALLGMGAEAAFLARLRQRRERDRALQREQRCNGEPPAPPVGAAKGARPRKHKYRSLRREGTKR